MMALYGVIIFIIILIIYCVASWHTTTYENYLYGMWTAPEDFRDISEISSMMLFLGKPESGILSESRPGYLVIMDNISNQKFTLTYRRGYSSVSLGTYTITADIEFESDQIWDSTVYVTVNIMEGTMVIKNDEGIIYAELVKDHETTNYCEYIDDVTLI